MAKDIEDNLNKAEKLAKQSKEKFNMGVEAVGQETYCLSGIYHMMVATYYQNKEMIKLLEEIKKEYIKNK